MVITSLASDVFTETLDIMIQLVISIAKEPILTFGILLLITLFVPLLFQKIKLPGIVGLLIAGSIVGQNGFGLIEAAGVIDVLGKVGLLYLMFLAGLEISSDQMKRDKKNIVVFGVLTFLIPQISGTVLFLMLGYSWPASILIASMFASHTLVAYPIIARLGLTKEKSVSTAIGGTIITDTAALLVLAIVARSFEGNIGSSFWLTFITLFIVYLVFMFYILPRISFVFFRSIGETGRFTYVYVIGVMLLCAWVAEVIGIEAIVGAFFAGLSFNQLLSNKGPLKNRIEFFGDAFFIPLFLVYVGMLVDFSVFLSSSAVWIVMISMVSTVIITKWLAAFATGRILGFTNSQSWVIFGLSNTQAAATLAAVFVGLQLNIFGDEVLNGAIMMILATCVIGPIVVEKYGLILTDSVTQELESITKVEQRILVPLSNPVTSSRLIEFASNLKRDNDLIIYPLSVLDTISDFQAKKDRTSKILDLAASQIHAINCRANPLMETNLNIAEGISLAVIKNDISDVVIGWNGKISASSRIFGSVLDQMLETTRQRVYVCKLDYSISTFRTVKILIPPKNVSSRTFLGLFENVLNLGENLNTRIEIYYMSDDRGMIDLNISLTRSSQTILFHEFDTFDELLNSLIESSNELDLLMVLNQRNFDFGWASGVNLIPQILAKKNPNISFVIAYPENMDTMDYRTDLLFTN